MFAGWTASWHPVTPHFYVVVALSVKPANLAPPTCATGAVDVMNINEPREPWSLPVPSAQPVLPEIDASRPSGSMPLEHLLLWSPYSWTHDPQLL